MEKLNISKETVIGIMLLSLVCSAFLFKPLTANASVDADWSINEPMATDCSAYVGIRFTNGQNFILYMVASSPVQFQVNLNNSNIGLYPGVHISLLPQSDPTVWCVYLINANSCNYELVYGGVASGGYTWTDSYGAIAQYALKGNVHVVQSVGTNVSGDLILSFNDAGRGPSYDQFQTVISQLQSIYSTLQTISQTQLININGNLSAILNQFRTFFQFYQDNFGSASLSGNNLLGWLHEIYDLLQQIVDGTGNQQQAVQDAVNKIDEVVNGFDNDSFQQSQNDSSQMYGDASSSIDGAINDIGSITDPLNDAVSGNGASGVLLSSLRLFVEDKYMGTMITVVGILCVFSYLVFGKRE